MNGIVGIDWSQMKSIAEILGVPLDAGMMDRLRVIERVRLETAKEPNA